MAIFSWDSVLQSDIDISVQCEGAIRRVRTCAMSENKSRKGWCSNEKMEKDADKKFSLKQYTDMLRMSRALGDGALHICTQRRSPCHARNVE